VFAGTAVGVFAGALEAGGKVLGLVVDGGAELTRKQLGALTDQAKARGAKGLAWVAVESGGLRSPLDRFFSDAERDGLRRVTGAGPGDLLLIAADRAQVARTILGDLRVRPAAERGLCTYWRPAPARSATCSPSPRPSPAPTRSPAPTPVPAEQLAEVRLRSLLPPEGPGKHG